MILNFFAFLHKVFFDSVRPILAFIGQKHFPYVDKKMTGSDYYKLCDILKPGQILLTRTMGEFTTLLIPGFWKHAAIYRGDTVDGVVEAVGSGVRTNDLVSFIMKTDYVLVVEPLFLGDMKKAIMEKSVQHAAKQVGLPYNFDFDFSESGNRAFYCSELVWWSYDQSCKEFGIECPFVPRPVLGVPTITPDDIASATSKFKIIWDSRNR